MCTSDDEQCIKISHIFLKPIYLLLINLSYSIYPLFSLTLFLSLSLSHFLSYLMFYLRKCKMINIWIWIPSVSVFCLFPLLSFTCVEVTIHLYLYKVERYKCNLFLRYLYYSIKAEMRWHSILSFRTGFLKWFKLHHSEERVESIGCMSN